MKNEKCGCISRKITKAEIQDYPEDTIWICEHLCKKHQSEFDKEYNKRVKK